MSFATASRAVRAPGPVANVTQTKKWTKNCHVWGSEKKVGFLTFSPQPSFRMENPMTPSELQHQHCPKPMRWGHETSDSKRFWFFWTDGRTDGRTQKRGWETQVLGSRCTNPESSLFFGDVNDFTMIPTTIHRRWLSTFPLNFPIS